MCWRRRRAANSRRIERISVALVLVLDWWLARISRFCPLTGSPDACTFGRTFEMGDSTNLPLEGLRSLVDLTGEAACLVDARPGESSLRICHWCDSRGSPSNRWPGAVLLRVGARAADAAVRAQLAELAAGKRESARIDFRKLAEHDGQPILEIRATRSDRFRRVVGDGAGNRVGWRGG